MAKSSKKKPAARKKAPKKAAPKKAAPKKAAPKPRRARAAATSHEKVNPLPAAVYHERLRPRDPDVRGDYFRDQTAIIHAQPFRRLKRKTQVFFDPRNDHICTRIEHSLHVATVAATICKGLGLDAELAQAAGLGHDLGHPPCGHAGEVVLNDRLAPIGGFKHELQSLRVVDRLANRGRGLNLTYGVRDAIVSHCGETDDQLLCPSDQKKDLFLVKDRATPPTSWEGCVLRLADKIAYLGRDIEDAVTARFISVADVPTHVRDALGETNGEIIDTLVADVIAYSSQHDCVGFSPDVHAMVTELKNFNYDRIYTDGRMLRFQRFGGGLIMRLFDYLTEIYERNGLDPHAYETSPEVVDRRFGHYIEAMLGVYSRGEEGHALRVVGDYVSGMSDTFAIECVRHIVFPDSIVDPHAWV